LCTCADLQSVHGFRRYDNLSPNAKCQRVLVLDLCLFFLFVISWLSFSISVQLNIPRRIESYHIVRLLCACNRLTRHRASTSMYSLTFCVRFLLPERHQRKPAVQVAAVMLRTPPSTANHRRASHAHVPYTARNFANAPVTRQSAASSTRRPRPAGRSHYVVISRDGRKLIIRVRVMLP